MECWVIKKEDRKKRKSPIGGGNHSKTGRKTGIHKFGLSRGVVKKGLAVDIRS